MNLKTITGKIKALGDGANGLDVGEFTAYAATFDVKDSYGDVIVKGAFADTLKDWSDGPNPIPLYWAHQMASDPEFNIGQILGAEEDDHGLLVRAKLDLEPNEITGDVNRHAAQTYKLLKSGRVGQMSFAYDVQDYAQSKSEDLGDYLELRKLKLHEVSVVPVGANQETEVLAVKAASELLAKAGRVLSAKNLSSLVSARDALTAVIDSQSSDDDEKSGTSQTKSAPSLDGDPDAWAILLA